MGESNWGQFDEVLKEPWRNLGLGLSYIIS